MKITVKVNGRSFVVEIGDLTAKPVVALVDGERFEVWPEDIERLEIVSPAVEQALAERAVSPLRARGTKGVETSGAVEAGSPVIVKAPLPGVIESVAVEPGTQVNPGDELCVIEAMKMKNTIRASRAGTIKAIKVAVGQHVQHSDALMEFSG